MSNHRRKLFVFYLVIAFLVTGLPSHADTFRPVVRGKRGVVAGGAPLSVEAGLRILQRGGNAVDAGVATILAASVIEFSHFSFGGEVPILIKLKGQKVVVIEGMGTAPMKATREFFVNRAHNEDGAPTLARKGGLIPSTGPLSATVPAVLDACVVALDQFGTKSLAEVMEPAIQLADGFPLDELRVNYIRSRSPIFSQWPDAKRIFLPGGEVPKVGEIFVQADLARTLREIVRAERLASKSTRNNRHAGLMAARDYFYRGPIARRIGTYMQANGGLLAADDFAKFAAKVGQPVETSYHGYEVYKAGFWTQGPALIETLNMLEGFDLKKMGHNSPTYIHTLAEALKLAMADRDRYYGDPNFVKIPMAELLSKNYAALRRPLIVERNA
jgi:gamma-glutamyltranspeptidase/glutathione hydrolase